MILRRPPAHRARPTDGRGPDRWIVARPVAQFTAIGLAGLVTVGLATLVASQRIGQREAITDVRTTTLVRAQGLVEPVVTDGLIARKPASLDPVAAAVTHGVLDANLVRVKIWTASGTIVYSDERRLEGSTYPLEDDELDALRTGSIAAGVSNLDKPENRYERGYHKLLEVYLPIRTPSGQRLLFEAYYRFDVVSASADRIWRSFAPVALGALLVLELLQIPLAWSLARRLRQRQDEREALLHRVLEASDVERRRIAGDLHDGVVQDLTGVTYSLAGAARARATPAPTAALLADAAESVRASVVDLRSLMVDLYPPDLEERGFESALEDLSGPMSRAGVAATFDVSALTRPLPTPVATLFYRAGREALRNVLAHAGASSVSIVAGSDAQHAWLRVIDDGVGFDPARAEARAAGGHLGLRTIDGLARDLGGSLVVTGSGATGTLVELEVPLP
jgi:two-component system, NarL family, sensor kinase